MARRAPAYSPRSTAAAAQTRLDPQFGRADRPQRIPLEQENITMNAMMLLDFATFLLKITAAIIITALISMLIGHIAYGAESTAQRDAPTTRFYDSRGNVTGSASTYGNQTKFYDARGNHVGNAVSNGSRR